MLSVSESRRSRSKSPGGGRDRSRSRSAVRDDRDYDRRSNGHHRSSSKRYSESESSSESDGDRRHKSSSRRSKHYSSESEDDRRKSSKKSSSRKKSDSDSDRDRRRDKRKSSGGARDASDEEDITISIKRGQLKGKRDGEKVTSPRGSSNAVQSGYGYPQQPEYVPGGFPAERPGHYHDSRHMSYVGQDPRYVPPPGAAYDGDGHGRPHPARSASNAGPQYANVDSYRYAEVDPRNVGYRYDDPRRSDSRVSDPRDKRYVDDKYARREVETERKERKTLEKKLEHEQKDKYREEGYEKAKKELERKQREEKKREEAAQETARRVSRLSLSGGSAMLGATLGVAAAGGGGHGHGSGGKPPPSPLLEAYKGTYQSISPMPSALVLASHKNDSDLSDLDLESDSSSSEESEIDARDPNADIKRKIRKLEKEKKAHEKARIKQLKKEKEKQKEKEHERQRMERIETRVPDDDLDTMLVAPGAMVRSRSPAGRKSVSFYNPERDAKTLEKALKGDRNAPDPKPLIHILPLLSIDDLDALKIEYKKHAKVQGQGINLSKHIKMRVPGYLGKAAYATSLGQWESEGFWANCFYQSGASRRELLIESLMGRTNQQIREIKNFFKDKRYDDDLEKCMKTELKADKFRVAILLALQEERMPESPQLDIRLVRQDVVDLHDALTGAGGESAMLKIIVMRSDIHLREVLRVYEREYRSNFARDMISKSKNLVGETLAHILNGALNRPMRDALLIHQAISETAPGKERAELLISRLVRMHWEPKHLAKVNQVYKGRYNTSIEAAIKREIQVNMKTEEGINWTNFCIELCRSCEQQR